MKNKRRQASPRRAAHTAGHVTIHHRHRAIGYHHLARSIAIGANRPIAYHAIDQSLASRPPRHWPPPTSQVKSAPDKSTINNHPSQIFIRQSITIAQPASIKQPIGRSANKQYPLPSLIRRGPARPINWRSPLRLGSDDNLDFNWETLAWVTHPDSPAPPSAII